MTRRQLFGTVLGACVAPLAILVERDPCLPLTPQQECDLAIWMMNQPESLREKLGLNQEATQRGIMQILGLSDAEYHDWRWRYGFNTECKYVDRIG